MKQLNKIEEKAIATSIPNSDTTALVEMCNNTLNPRLTAALLLGIVSVQDIKEVFKSPFIANYLLKKETDSRYSDSRREYKEVKDVKVDLKTNDISYTLVYDDTEKKFKRFDYNLPDFTKEPIDITEEEFEKLEGKTVSSYNINTGDEDYRTYNVFTANKTQNKETSVLQLDTKEHDRVFKGNEDAYTLLDSIMQYFR